MIRLKFLLVGAELSRNRGTAAIALSAIAEIRRVFENPDITLLSYSPGTDKCFETELAVRIPGREPKVKVFAETIILIVEKLLGIRLFHGECRKNEYRDSDVVISLGGDGFSDDWGPMHSILSWLPSFWCMVLNVPMVIYSQSIGPFRNRIALRVARFFLSRVRLLIVREDVTETYLTQIGVKRRIFLTADGAFLLNPVPDGYAREILMRERIPLNRGRPLVGIAPSELIFRLARTGIKSDTGQYVDGIIELVDVMIDEHDVDVIFVPHVTDANMDIDDRDVAVSVASRCKHRDRIFVIEGEYRPEELKGIIGLCALFVGSRMHANIAALSMHVPTVAVSYSHKSLGIMSLAGLNHYVFHWRDDPPERLLRITQEAWENRAEIRKHLRERIPEIELMARRNAELVLEEAIQERGRDLLSKGETTRCGRK